MRKFSYLIFMPLAGCSGADRKPNDAVNDAIVTDTAAVIPSTPIPASSSSVAMTAAQMSMVCRSGIAILMGRDPKTMKAARQPSGLTRIAYRRPNDSKLWETDCRIDGNRFLWRGVDSFGNDGPGRWRDGPEDEVITFAINGKTVVMNERYSDGSTTSETYRF